MNASYRYSTLGLTLVCDRPLPYVAPVDAPARRPVTVRLAVGGDRADGETGWRTVLSSSARDDAGEPRISIARHTDDGTFRFRYADGVTFHITSDGRSVDCRWRESSSIEDATTYLLGPVLSFVVRLRGMVPLHASAVAVDGVAIALAGVAGAGKSTTAAAFATLGYVVLSDDVVALQAGGDGFVVLPDCPFLKLWPRSAELLWGSRDALPNLSTTWDKRYLPLADYGYPSTREAHPLAAVYLLDREASEPATLEIEPLAGRDALLGLTRAVHGLCGHDEKLHARQFDTLSRLLREVPLRRVPRPAQGFLPRDLARAVLADFRGSGVV